MQIFNRRAAALTLCLSLPFLAGCLGAIGGSGGGLREMVVTTDALVIAGPEGYCIDSEASADRGETAFILLGNCAALTEARLARQPAEPAILTAAISEAGEEGGVASSLSSLPEFFASEDGRRVLSRSGDAETVEVLQSFVDGSVFYLNASDDSANAVPGVRDDYWRAYFDLGPRIATLSVLALDGSGLTEEQSIDLLRRFATLTQSRNAAVTGVAVSEPEPSGGLLGGGGFMGRLFGGRG
ncbi:MAG: hypothetical protein AAFQ06_04235 [Pseudomonadota bacterium]